MISVDEVHVVLKDLLRAKGWTGDSILNDPAIAAKVMSLVLACYGRSLPEDDIQGICANVELRGEMKEGHERGDYSLFLNLKPDRAPTDRPTRHPRPLDLEWDKAGPAGLAFKGAYTGSDSELLGRYIDELFERSADSYNNSVAIVQSSGTGKSRTVDELAKTRFCFPLNLRQALSSSQIAYPPGDLEVIKYFAACFPMRSNDVRSRCAFFFEALFQTAITRLATAPNSDDISSLPLRWHAYLADGQTESSVGPNRQDLYREALETANQRRVMLPIVHATDDDLETAKAALVDSFRKLLSVVEGRATAGAMKPEPPHVDVRTYKGPKVIVYFDESDFLSHADPYDHSRLTLYEDLGHVLAWLKNEPIFFAFLSMNSALSSFAPPALPHSSLRKWQRTGLHAAFTQLSLDHFAPPSGQGLTLSQACTTKHLVQYGRPLWETQFKFGGDSVKNAILPFAVAKLTSGALSDEALIAALGVRVLLDFASSGISKEKMSQVLNLERTLVKSHLRITHWIPPHGNSMKTGSPCEPIVAEAAAQVLNGRDRLDSHAVPSLNNRAPTIIQDALQKGLLARDKRGGLGGRLLWTLAHDTAINNMWNVIPGRTTAYHQPIPVLAFLKALFNETWHDTILEARPVSNPDGPPLEDAFSDAWLMFTQFEKAEDQDIVTRDHLWKGLERGIAFECTNAQRSVDKAVPIHFGRDKPICAQNTGALLGQDRNRSMPEDVLVNPLVFYTASQPDPIPILSLAMEHGSDEAYVTSASAEFPPTRSASKANHMNHYQLVVHGCGNSTYAVIPKEKEGVYAGMLTPLSDLDPIHAPHASLREPMMRQLPYITKDSF